MSGSDTTIPVSTATRQKVRSMKRGGESYDTLIRKMMAGYDPENPEPDAGR